MKNQNSAADKIVNQMILKMRDQNTNSFFINRDEAVQIDSGSVNILLATFNKLGWHLLVLNASKDSISESNEVVVNNSKYTTIDELQINPLTFFTELTQKNGLAKYRHYREQYDFVLIDPGYLNDKLRFRILNKFCSNELFLIKLNQTKRHALLKMWNRSLRANTSVLGVCYATD